MPAVYANRDEVPEFKGTVKGGLAVVVHDPAEIGGLQDLVTAVAALPGDPLANLYRVVADAGPSLAAWPGFGQTQPLYPAPPTGESRPRGTVPDARESMPHPQPVEGLQAALGLALNAWTAQGEDIGELSCAMLLPRPGRRLRFTSKRPSLTLDHGSIRARALAAGATLRQFGVALFPVARSRRQIDLMETLRGRATGLRLPRLESLQPAEFAGKTGVVIFLHGLIATDVGTFDAFVELLQAQPDGTSLLFTAWPHDTLDPIALNAEMLAEHIERTIGPTALPIAFVCHSRGGLVARPTAVQLIKANALWRSRLRGAVTFGTPHDGAELAEKGDELLGKVLLLRATGQGAGAVPLVDALWAVRNVRTRPGITDLRPRKNGGEFLRRLRKAEGKLAGAAGGRPMPIFAVGGNTQGNGTSGWLTRRLFRGVPNDLVVALASTMPDGVEARAETSCDHFGYFSGGETKKGHAAAAVRFIQQSLTAPPQHGVAAAPGLDDAALASHRHANRAVRKGALAQA